MPPEVPPTALEQQQREFARLMRDESGAPDAGFAVYRNNARQAFRTALAATYPVLVRRVGEDYFGQLARDYRALHPSRSGDLHWVGREFPAWLRARLASTPYAWLAELARLEWACEESAVAPRLPPLELSQLAGIGPETLDAAVVGLQPSLRLVASEFAIWSVWQANQGEVPGAPVDVDSGPEYCACASVEDRVAVYRVDAGDFALLQALQLGEPLARAVECAGVTPDRLARVLGWAFAENLVVALSPRPA